MQKSSNRAQLAAELKNKNYIDNYVDRWLKLDALDKPQVECEICGYVSNASIHQHLLIPEESGHSEDNRILHLCANCYDELRALIAKHRIVASEGIPQICGDAFERLKEKKKHYREANKSLERIEI